MSKELALHQRKLRSHAQKKEKLVSMFSKQNILWQIPGTRIVTAIWKQKYCTIATQRRSDISVVTNATEDELLCCRYS
jgi:hypothetical protein